jgi:hypothetical protein
MKEPISPWNLLKKLLKKDRFRRLLPRPVLVVRTSTIPEAMS